MKFSLRTLIITTVALVVITTSLLLGTLLLRKQEQALSGHLEEKALYLSQTMAALAEPGVVMHDEALLQTLSERAKQDPDVSWIHIQDGGGEYLSQSGEKSFERGITRMPRPKNSRSPTPGTALWYVDDAYLMIETQIQSTPEEGGFEALALGNANLGPKTVIGRVRLILSTEGVKGETRRAGSLVANVTALVIALGLILAIALSSRLVKPLNSMIAAILQISSGERDVQVLEASTPELQKLTQAFNAMVRTLEERDQKLQENEAALRGQAEMLSTQKAALETANQSLEVVNDSLEQTNQELRLRESQLRDSNTELLNASQLKSQFLASMSHELRTPLNSIIGYTECLLDGLDGPINDDQQESLERVQRNGHHLLSLINDILDLSRIEAGQLQLQWASILPKEIAAECVAMVRPLAKDKALKFTILTEGHVGKIQTDASRFRQILINLLSNAVKFTPEGEIRIEFQGDEEGIWVSIADTGVGISPEDLKEIFLEFRQVDSQDDRGTGLGLAITKRLVEAMKGVIRVESTLGQGSTFKIWLPRGR